MFLCGRFSNEFIIYQSTYPVFYRIPVQSKTSYGNPSIKIKKWVVQNSISSHKDSYFGPWPVHWYFGWFCYCNWLECSANTTCHVLGWFSVNDKCVRRNRMIDMVCPNHLAITSTIFDRPKMHLRESYSNDGHTSVKPTTSCTWLAFAHTTDAVCYQGFDKELKCPLNGICTSCWSMQAGVRSDPGTLIERNGNAIQSVDGCTTRGQDNLLDLVNHPPPSHSDPIYPTLQRGAPPIAATTPPPHWRGDYERHQMP